MPEQKYYRLVCHWPQNIEVAVSTSTPMSRVEAEQLAQGLAEQGLEVFIVEADPPGGEAEQNKKPKASKIWRGVPPFKHPSG